MADIVVEKSDLDKFAGNLDRAKRQMLGRLAERGYQLLKDEVPVKTGLLKSKGVGTPTYDFENMSAEIIVSAARDARTALSGELYNAKGEAVRSVTLKPSKAFNYAESVARGRRGFTAKGNVKGSKGESPIGPGFAKALLIPVPTVEGESYILAGGQKYIFRRSVKATKPNPFDERAAKRLESEAPKIGQAVLDKFFD